MTYAEAKPSGLSKVAIEGLASSIAKQIGFVAGEDGKDDIHDAIKRTGGKLEIKDFWDLRSDSGSIIINAPEDYTIYVSSETSALRDRFTIAHEFGHYVLHYLWPHHRDKKSRPMKDENPSPMKADRYGSDRTEWEANWFAASFLMPEATFRALYREKNGSIIEVANSLKVSQAAAKVRAEALGLMK